MSEEKIMASTAVVESPAEIDIEAESDIRPSEAEIAERAYTYWNARGCVGGSPEEDWFRAEEELRAQTREQN